MNNEVFTQSSESKRCRLNGKQCRPWSDCSSRSSLIWVYTVCLGLSVRKLRIITVVPFLLWLLSVRTLSTLITDCYWNFLLIVVLLTCSVLPYLRYSTSITDMSQLMKLWYLSHRRPAKAQASLRIWAVSPQPSLFAHMKYGSRWRVRAKNQTSSPTGWLHMCVWRMSLQRTKSALISWAGSYVQ